MGLAKRRAISKPKSKLTITAANSINTQIIIITQIRGIEVKFDELKNRLQIQSFTGDTVISVEQDFYASIYLSNMAALVKNEANEIIAHNNEDKNLKFEYKVNTNILIGNLKDSIVIMLLEDNSENRHEMFQSIMQKIVKNMVPIRPGRSKVRKMGLKANKYPMNQKRCI